MGGVVSAKCRKCGKAFEYSDGGGFFFHLVRCDRCGKTKSVPFSRLGELHLRYLKGLPGPCAYATRDTDRKVQEEYPGEPSAPRIAAAPRPTGQPGLPQQGQVPPIIA